MTPFSDGTRAIRHRHQGCSSPLIALLVCAICALLLPAPGHTQTFSYDGNRWYEVEVSIFTNNPDQTLFPEQPLTTGEALVYPRGTRTLDTATSSLQVTRQVEPPIEPAIVFDFSDEDFDQDPAEPVLFYGPPEFNGAGLSMLQDTARAAFTLLGPEAAGFARHNSRLRNAGGHRLLFHGVWRQPMLNRTQSVPVAITGGSRFAPHNELEGWLQFSFNVNRIDVDANLWFMQFVPENAFRSGEAAIMVPVSPVENNRLRQQPNQLRDEQRYQVSQLWKLEETRQVTSNNLHYLDHPRLGMLVEVRPYELPLDGAESPE